jgi:hypothetical protein
VRPVFLGLCLSAALSACNIAISDYPMFSEDQQSKLRAKDGVWLAEDPKCRFDTSSPAHHWPKCAQWFYLHNDEVADGPGAKPGDRPVKFLIVDGLPPLLQVPIEDKDEHTTTYAFAALELPAAMTSGQLTEARLWLVACGVERHSTKRASDIKPFPGIDKDCKPQSAAALRNAAIASRPKRSRRVLWRRVRTSPE